MGMLKPVLTKVMQASSTLLRKLSDYKLWNGAVKKQAKS